MSYAQSRLDEIRGVKAKSITPEYIHEQAQKAKTGDIRHDEIARNRLAQEAIISGKDDVIKACFHSFGMRGPLLKAVVNLQQGPYRDHLISILLKEKWPNDKDSDTYLYGSPLFGLYDGSVSLMEREFPENGLGLTRDEIEKRMWSHSSRVELAELFLQKKKEKAQSPSPEQARPQDDVPDSATTNDLRTIEEHQQNEPDKSPALQSSEEKSMKGEKAMYWLYGGLGTLAVALFWRFFRKRQPTRP